MEAPARSRIRIALALGLVAACAGRSGVRDVEPADAATEPDSVFVEVINDNYYDVRIHVLYEGGARVSLGTVGGNRRQGAVAIAWHPRALVVEVTLIIGGGVYVSDKVNVGAGDTVEVRVPVNIEASGFFRRVSQ
jgi:hypothetical protein